MGSPLCDRLHCDWYLNSDSVNKYDHSRIPLFNNYVSDTQVGQCFQQGLCLCQRCVSNPNFILRFPLLRNGTNNKSAYNCRQYLDLDFSFSSSPSSFSDCNRAISFVSLPLYNEDLSSYFETFQIFENFTKNYSEQQVTMLQPDIPKDSLCSGFNGYETKEDIDNVFVNTFDGDKKDFFALDQLMDEITKHNAETTPTKILASSHKDYNVEALAKASSQDYYKNQVIGSLAKEETSKFGIFPNALVQLDCGQSQFIVTEEMLQREESKRQIREEAKKRYLAKKKNRKFGKQIRYASRKSTADTKRRMKGRFTKAGAEYDYDPRANNINKGTDKSMS